VLDEHLPLAFDVSGGPGAPPAVREEDIEKEKGVILEEIKMENDSPDYLVHEIFSANFWKDHALGKPILGTRETVKRSAARRFRLTMPRSTRLNLTVTAAGNLSTTAWWRWCGASSTRSRRPSRRRRIAFPTRTRASRCATRKALEQVHLCLGVPSYPMRHQQRFAVMWLNTLLGGGMSSRLFQNIRDARAWPTQSSRN